MRPHRPPFHCCVSIHPHRNCRTGDSTGEIEWLYAKRGRSNFIGYRTITVRTTLGVCPGRPHVRKSMRGLPFSGIWMTCEEPRPAAWSFHAKGQVPEKGRPPQSGRQRSRFRACGRPSHSTKTKKHDSGHSQSACPARFTRSRSRAPGGG